MSAREGMSVDEALKLAAQAETPDARGLDIALATLAAEVRSLRGLCAAAYQAAGASDWPVEWLDNFSDAANGDPLRHDPASLLPFASPVEPERSLANARPAFDMERSQPTAVPEAAVEAALDSRDHPYSAPLRQLFHQEVNERKTMRLALTAALPHLPVYREFGSDGKPFCRRSWNDGKRAGVESATEFRETFFPEAQPEAAKPPDMEALRRDAERYRFLRGNGMGFTHDDAHRGISCSRWGDWHYDTDEGFAAQTDAAIDAAISQRDTSEGGG